MPQFGVLFITQSTRRFFGHHTVILMQTPILHGPTLSPLLFLSNSATDQLWESSLTVDSRAQYLLVASFVMKSATAISLPFLLFIYIDGNIHKDVAPQVVWSANQKNPISINATLRLSSERGLVLQDEDANWTTVWYTNIGTKSVVGLYLSDMGNIMPLNQNNKTIWQSFDHPTDSLLPWQKLMVGQRLTSSVPAKYQIVFALPLWGGVVRFHRL